jgi:hypothetical protein
MPRNALAAGGNTPAPPPRLGLDADALKVLRDMTPSLRAAAASGQPQQ